MSSLQERVAARRADRARERTFEIPVRGYEDLGLYARYRVLTYEEIRDVDVRNGGQADGPEDELVRYADTLIEACVALVEKTADGFTDLGCKWSSAASVLRENLGIDVPDGATSREVLSEVFNGNGGGNDLFLHWYTWDLEASKTTAELDKEQAGEPRPSEEGTSRLEPTPSPEESLSTPGSSIPAPIPTTLRSSRILAPGRLK